MEENTHRGVKTIEIVTL